MNHFTEIDPKSLMRDPNALCMNPFEKIGSTWMLITAGDTKAMNTMTASWGALGVLWSKCVSHCYVRPQRYTRDFMDAQEYYTLTFFGEEYRHALQLCGTKSGRDMDKIAAAGLTPAYADCGAPYFEEADLVLVCRKIYWHDFSPDRFLDPSIDKNYDLKDYHRAYVGEIIQVLQRTRG